MSHLSIYHSHESPDPSINLLKVKLNRYIDNDPDLFCLYEMMVIRINRALETLPF